METSRNPSTDPAPRRRGVVGVIVRSEQLLVIRRSQHVVAPGAYCFPGGAIEGNESEPEALVRELHEELSVIGVPVRSVWRSTTPWGVDLAWWLAELPPEAEPIAVPAEVESIHWLLPAEMAELPELLESNRQFLAALASGEITLAAGRDGPAL